RVVAAGVDADVHFGDVLRHPQAGEQVERVGHPLDRGELEVVVHLVSHTVHGHAAGLHRGHDVVEARALGGDGRVEVVDEQQRVGGNLACGAERRVEDV